MKKLISLLLLLSLVLTACNKAEPTTPEESDITEETTAEDEEEPEEEEEKPAEQTSVPAEKKNLVIVINGENERVTYDGEEHLLDRFVATANEDFFDESKLKVEGNVGVKGTDCGGYRDPSART